MSTSHAMQLEAITTIDLKQRVGQCRAVPVQLGPGQPRAFLVVYAADFDVDPCMNMFFFPTDTLKMALYTVTGECLWRRDLGPSVVPGMWFCPVLAFDLDGDGVDEIYFANNTNPQHPLAVNDYCLQQVDAHSGADFAALPWPKDNRGRVALPHAFRYFLLGGQVNGQPVLVMANGTYGDMQLRAFDAGLRPRWETCIAADAPGARGSHMSPVVDIDGDGNDELLWGERCLRLDDGSEMFCGDRDSYRGHSDIVQPSWDATRGSWIIHTCRENDDDVSPRVAAFDGQGQRLWGAVDHGHMDMGWVARLQPGGRQLAAAIRIGAKTCGPDGRFHAGMDEFIFDLETGTPVELGFSIYGTLPVDLNGDGAHELVRGNPSSHGDVLNGQGQVIGSVGGAICLASKFLDHPGEQLLSYHEDGLLHIWADRNAEDSPAALARYAHPFYRTNQRLTLSGANLANLGGL